MAAYLWWRRIGKWIGGSDNVHRSTASLIHAADAEKEQREKLLEALPVTGGFAFVASYQQMNEPDGEWLRNVLAAGSAKLRLDGEVFSLVNPRLEAFGAARARLHNHNVELLGALKFGDMLLVMDQHHRCISSCERRRRRSGCGRCIGQDPMHQPLGFRRC